MGFFNSIVRDIHNSAAVISHNQNAPVMSSQYPAATSSETGYTSQMTNYEKNTASNQSSSGVDSKPGNIESMSIRDTLSEMSGERLLVTTELEGAGRIVTDKNHNDTPTVMNESVEISDSTESFDNEVVQHDQNAPVMSGERLLDTTQLEGAGRIVTDKNYNDTPTVMNESVEISDSTESFDNEVVQHDPVNSFLKIDNKMDELHTSEVDLDGNKHNIDQNDVNIPADNIDNYEPMDVSVPGVHSPTNMIDEDYFSSNNDAVSVRQSHYSKKPQKTNEVKTGQGEDSGVLLNEGIINKTQASGNTEYMYKDKNDKSDSILSPDVEPKLVYRDNVGSNSSGSKNPFINKNEAYEVGSETPGADSVVLKTNNNYRSVMSDESTQSHPDNRVFNNEDKSEMVSINKSLDSVGLETQSIKVESKPLYKKEGEISRSRMNQVNSQYIEKNKTIEPKGLNSAKDEIIIDNKPEKSSRVKKQSDDNKSLRINDINKNEKASEDKYRSINMGEARNREVNGRNKPSKIDKPIVPNVVIGVIDITVAAPLQSGTETVSKSTNFDFVSRNYLRRL